jgi:DNA-binding winged helix-turn-helix (wHTH) protein/tetratricopeptide (TPR) repeat protein
MTYRFGEFVLNSETRQLLRSGQPLHLSPKAFHLLEALVSRRPRVWSKTELQDLLWPETVVVEANLPNLVAEVRAVLDDDPQQPQFVRTVHRYGYGFMEPPSSPVLPRTLQSAITGADGFVGRTEELAVLDATWQRVRTGNRQVMLVAGEAGIGKTRLIGEFARRCLDTGAVILVGHCDEEALTPYQPFVEALTQFFDQANDAGLAQQLREGDLGSDIARLVPNLTVRIPELGRVAVIDPESERFHLFQAVDRLLSSASKRTALLVLLDDLHWADKSSLLLLRHLARGAPSTAIFLVGTYRGDGVEQTPFGALLADLHRDQSAARMALRGLPMEDVERLVQVIIGRRPIRTFMKSLANETSGNPFFIREVLQHLKDAGDLDEVDGTGPVRHAANIRVPDSVKEVIGQRLGRLTEPCRRALSLASVLGREFGLGVLAQVGKFNEDQLLDALEAARAAGLIIEEQGAQGRFSFSHALVREALYEKLSMARRVRLHSRIAEVLEQMFASGACPLADLAYHFVQAAPQNGYERAIEYSTRAAREATDSLAHEEAAQFYEMAVHALSFSAPSRGIEDLRASLHAHRGDALASVGNWLSAKSAFDAALQHLDSTHFERRAELLLKLAMANFWLLDIAAVRPLVTEALGLAEQVCRPDLAAEALGWLGRAEQADGNLQAAIDVDRRAFALRGAAITGALVLAPLTLYLAGKLPGALQLASNVLEGARSSGESSPLIYALTHYGLALAANGQYTEAAASFDEVREFARSSGAFPLLARATAMAAGWRLDVFDFSKAEALQREAREIASEAAFVPSQVSAGIDLLLSYARQGNPERAEPLLREVDEAMAKARGWHEWLFRLRLEQARAELALARGDWAMAITRATSAIQQSRRVARGKYEAAGLTVRAQGLQAIGRPREAVRDANLASSVARRVGDPALQVRILASLLCIIGDDELLQEVRAIIAKVRAALPAGSRQAFEAAPLVRTALTGRPS